MGKNGAGVAKNVLYKKPCKCIGSIAIPQQFRNDAQLFVNDKFDEMKDVVKGIPVVVMVTDEGVKILRENDETVVRMAHGVPKIQFSSCQPERKLFAYVAKARTADRKSVLQVHLFKTKRSSHTKELNASLSKAFKLFAEKATVERKDVMKSFDVQTPESQNPEIRGKRWAKHEIARGHQNSGHAQLAQQRMSQVVDSGMIATPVSPPESSLSISPVLPNATLTEQKNQKRSTPPKKVSKQHTLNTSADRIRSVYGSPQSSLAFTETEPEKIVCASGSSEYFIAETSPSTNKLTEDVREVCEKPKTPKLQREEECDELDTDDDSENPARIMSSKSRDENDILDISCMDSDSSVTTKPVGIATPAQRFSTVFEPTTLLEEPLPPANGTSKPAYPLPSGKLGNLQIAESSFEGYVNVVDKSREPLPALPDEDDIIRDSQLFEMTEEDILRNAEWFQEGFSREVAESVLADCSVGAFFVRNSQTKVGNYALTVRIPTVLKENGIGNFLIEFTDGKYHLKGFSSCFDALSDLVAHYGSCKEDIPVQLRLTCSNNTLYKMKCRASGKDTTDSIAISSTGNGVVNGVGNGGRGVDIDEEDEDDDNYTDIDYLRYTSADEVMMELAQLQRDSGA